MHHVNNEADRYRIWALRLTRSIDVTISPISFYHRPLLISCLHSGVSGVWTSSMRSRRKLNRLPQLCRFLDAISYLIDWLAGSARVTATESFVYSNGIGKRRRSALRGTPDIRQMSIALPPKWQHIRSWPALVGRC